MMVNKKLPAFESLKKVHVIGVCGTLMAPFATFLKRRGIDVTGSDENIYPPMSEVLKNAGVELFSGYRAENLLEMTIRPDLVVIGNVIRSTNPEARAAIEGGYAYTSLPEAMESLLLEKTCNLVVAGTHGKTTTSSLLAHTLHFCGRDPNFFIGGVSLDLPFSFQVLNTASGNYFVLEGDEYDTAFWDKVPKFNHYLPNHVILTSVEFDHADIYADFNAVKLAFHGLLERIRKNGHLIACFDDPSVQALVRSAKWGHQTEVISYGSVSECGARFTPGKIEAGSEWTQFEILEHGLLVDELKIRLPGKHNVLNALAVWIEARMLGLGADQVRRALEGFRGVKRRQEVRGEINEVLVIDDFAHHPTAVRETLRALRLRYPTRRLVAVFEPRSATSRRKVFQSDYVSALGEADVVFIAQPYDQSRIPVEGQFSSAQLVGDLQEAGRVAVLMKTVDQGVHEVASLARPGDLVAVLSNGGFDGFIAKFLAVLAEKSGS